MPTIKDGQGSTIRVYKCKNCGKEARVPIKRWQAIPQKFKRWCPECLEHKRVAEADLKERREYMPYGPYAFGRFGF